jgi:hypothetical protein
MNYQPTADNNALIVVTEGTAQIKIYPHNVSGSGKLSDMRKIWKALRGEE